MQITSTMNAACAEEITLGEIKKKKKKSDLN